MLGVAGAIAGFLRHSLGYSLLWSFKQSDAAHGPQRTY